MTMAATYSPEDNKLRLYAATRLDKELYQRVRNEGFIWAPKQELFVAPMWTPAREDFLLELCGEIGDEDTSLVERQEQRAERFEDYHDSRTDDAARAKKEVDRICDGIPLGQPILVGHHSERHARKDAERIENRMRKAVKMWETAQYWKARAAGALRHAKYKELPGVRARRIKGLEADQRKHAKEKKEAEMFLAAWQKCRDEADTEKQKEKALSAASIPGGWHYKFPVAEYPRKEGQRTYEGDMSLWSALDDGIITGAQAAELAIKSYSSILPWRDRWLTHLNNRLEYERAMLEEQGASDLLKPKARPEKLPLCNYRVAEGLDIENIYYRGQKIHYPLLEMTQEEYARINKDYKGTRNVGNSHRVRTAMRSNSLYYIFLTDAKVHAIPEPIEPKPPEPPKPREIVYREPEAKTPFDAMKDTLRAGIKTVSAPQLFPTPADLAARMVKIAGVEPGQEILEPSAGTGVICKAILAAGAKVFAVEINNSLCEMLSKTLPTQENVCKNVLQGDFLTVNSGEFFCAEIGKFDHVVMNPPFQDGADIKHITHAVRFLKPGGRVVAICANGPRQNDTLKPMAERSGGYWEVLPPDTFKEQGTGVNTALLVIEA